MQRLALCYLLQYLYSARHNYHNTSRSLGRKQMTKWTNCPHTVAVQLSMLHASNSNMVWDIQMGYQSTNQNFLTNKATLRFKYHHKVLQFTGFSAA